MDSSPTLVRHIKRQNLPKHLLTQRSPGLNETKETARVGDCSERHLHYHQSHVRCERTVKEPNKNTMKVGLFIPCYVDQFYPQTGLATVALLDHFGVTTSFPDAQTCCGQPMANTGCTNDARVLARRFVDIFADFQYVVAPSGSCVSMVRNHYPHLLNDMTTDQLQVCSRTFELSEFLCDVLDVDSPVGSFPWQVGVHQSCHGLRELRLAASSEVMRPVPDRLMRLLAPLEGIQFSKLDRPDECCGFGGTFAVAEEAVSCLMGNDRIQDHIKSGSQVITAGDMSCLMHLDGLIRRQNVPLRVMHFAEILKQAILPD
jgi:L-lactate dehydrogenase complex protein LldE